jgi:formylmethanofuran dehydrogenase subunit E
MAYNNDGGQSDFQPQTYKGNWKCSKCNGEITELRFEPDPGRLNQLLCLNCFREKKRASGGGQPFRR